MGKKKTQRDCFREYLDKYGSGSAKDICDYTIAQGISFLVAEYRLKLRSVRKSLDRMYEKDD